ncbi:MAG: YebC/PmpR family DNA-binding transcriptional regulator [Acidobacteriota bacterium]|jgi:YebC/PmpR family DNA-binding regulatory protein
MSGHSKWSTIKRKKGAADAARGRIFSRLVKEITVAARQGGGDIDANPRLRTAVAAAKQENMPADNIKRAIQRGTGEIPGVVYEEVNYEGYGPGGVAVLVLTATDNRNRTVAEIRKIFERTGGNLGELNSVAWMFSQKGVILVDASAIDEDDLLTVVLEAGADDLSVDDGTYEVTTAPAQFSEVRDALESHGIKWESAELAMVPSNYIELAGKDAERCLTLMEKLEDHDDVQGVYTNADIDAEALEAAS